jgi:hypothetical protein
LPYRNHAAGRCPIFSFIFKFHDFNTFIQL